MFPAGRRASPKTGIGGATIKGMTRSVPWEKIGGDPLHCHYCGVGLTAANRTRDHIVPRSAGGTQAIVNLTHSCETCNQKKSSDERWCACITCMAAVAYHAVLMQGRQALPFE